jgi:sugar phosphate permease
MNRAPTAPNGAGSSAFLHRWQIRVFASTWLCYYGFYFGRQAFSIVKSSVQEEFSWQPSDVAVVWATYLIAYAFGGFNAAASGSKIGPRRLLLAGMAVSIGANVAFGFANNRWTFMAFMILNGLAQATGWSGNVGTMAQWFRRSERGRVMGWWSTCYQIGAVMAKTFAAAVLGWLGWRYSFWGASLVLGGIWFFFYFLQRNRPEDVGLPPIESEQASAGAPADGPDPGWTRQLVTTIVLMGGFYFFVKYIRYALWSWAPFFLDLNFHVARDRAGYLSLAFDACGLLGAIAGGWISDRLFGARRGLTVLIMIVGMMLATVFLAALGSKSVTFFTVGIGLIGFMLFGPDSLISGAGAIDVGSRKRAIAAAGIINGMGSCGAVLQELVIGNLYQRDATNLTPIFTALMLSAMAATIIITLLVLRARVGKCNL